MLLKKILGFTVKIKRKIELDYVNVASKNAQPYYEAIRTRYYIAEIDGMPYRANSLKELFKLLDDFKIAYCDKEYCSVTDETNIKGYQSSLVL